MIQCHLEGWKLLCRAAGIGSGEGGARGERIFLVECEFE